MKKIKTYVVGGAINYLSWLKDLTEPVNEIEDAELVLFTGGADVDPALYAAHAHPTTSSNFKRDMDEVKIFSKAYALRHKCLGICRGAQFLCIMAGGKLIQHMHHNYMHKIAMKTFDESEEEIVEINSTHHQMQFPFNLPKEDYRILGYTTQDSKSDFHYLEKELVDVEIEAEIVHYPKINALAIQSHPEMLSQDQNKKHVKLFLDFMSN